MLKSKLYCQFFSLKLVSQFFRGSLNFKSKVFQQNKLFFKKTCVENQKGQVIVEYILLLVVSTFLALLLINLVTVDPDKNSPVFGYWGKLLKTIGADIST